VGDDVDDNVNVAWRVSNGGGVNRDVVIVVIIVMVIYSSAYALAALRANSLLRIALLRARAIA